MNKLKFLAALLAVLLFASEGLVAQDGTTIALQPFLSGLSSPVFMTVPPVPVNGRYRRRYFVVEQGGTIRLADVRRGQPIVFMNISSRVLFGGEQGLLGLAFHPQYASNRRFFVYYTRQPDGAITISEFHTSPTNPDVGDPNSERVILTIPHPSFGNHNGGTVMFGPDGYLYAGPGDGGSGNDPGNNAQNINQLLGKVIRIDVDTPPTPPAQYVNPPTNPFFGATPGADEIYALGLRNPYRFSFDKGGTHQLWLADVGQGAWEEVDNLTLGGNYGWRIYEGNQCTGLDGCAFPANYVAPIFTYSITGPRCAIIGGYVYRGTEGTLPLGSYVYGDYCTGEILLWDGTNQNLLMDTALNIVGFGEGEDGEIFVIGQGGTVDKIIAGPSRPDASVVAAKR